jgi:molybdenum cofactor cytidylyltransferase
MAPNGWYAIVLSAGGSSRWGGRPKALLPVGRETAVERVIRLATAAGAHRTAVVVGRHAAELAPRLPPGVEALSNPRWEQGRTGSVQVGLRWAEEAEGVLLWPVDHPFVGGTTPFRLLDEARRDAMALWVVPTYQGRGGHPVAIRREAFGEVLDLEPGTPLRSVLRRLGVQVARLPVDDPGVLESSDTPDEYRVALGRWEAPGPGG